MTFCQSFASTEPLRPKTSFRSLFWTMFSIIPSTQVPDKDVEALKTLGFEFESTLPIAIGSYGSVFMGRCNHLAKRKPELPDQSEEAFEESRQEVSLEGSPCVIKMCIIKAFGATGTQKDQLYNEAKRLVELRHPNIVELYLVFKSGPHRLGRLETMVSETRIYFVMEYINGGTLKEMLSLSRPMFDQSQGIQLIRELTAGLQYLHSEYVVHTDLHQSNIMLQRDRDNRYHIKIVDFGNTRELFGTNHLDDIHMYATHVIQILSRTNFTDNSLKKDLRQLTDDINNRKYRTIDHIEDSLIDLIGEEEGTDDEQDIGTYLKSRSEIPVPSVATEHSTPPKGLKRFEKFPKFYKK